MDVAKHLLLDLGAVWVLWLMLGLSLVTAVVAVERWLAFRAAGGDLAAIAEMLDDKLRAGDFAGAIAALTATRSVAAAIAAAGLRLADRGPAAAREAMESRAALERSRLGRRLIVIGTIGNNAPFVGLFGTVVGIVHAFDALGSPGGGVGAAGTQVASATVMHSIAEALVATAVGIAVALPAVAAYNFLHRRLTLLLEGSEVLSHLVLAYLSDGGQSGARAEGAAEVPRPRRERA
jgi:biopolymer transport protein ExbB